MLVCSCGLSQGHCKYTHTHTHTSSYSHIQTRAQIHLARSRRVHSYSHTQETPSPLCGHLNAKPSHHPTSYAIILYPQCQHTAPSAHVIAISLHATGAQQRARSKLKCNVGIKKNSEVAPLKREARSAKVTNCHKLLLLSRYTACIFVSLTHILAWIENS